MLMGGIARNDGKPKPRWWSERVTPCPCPDDFEQVFVRIGRQACQEHYRVGRPTINSWLNQRGKERLIRDRAKHVTKKGEESSWAVARYGRETVDNWRAEGLTRGDVGRMLSAAIPVVAGPLVSETLARSAAQFLRQSRNGGLFVSPTAAGDWWVGLVRKSAAELVEMAKAKGFRPASLTGDGDAEVNPQP
jgi:hypothetical protein